MYNVIQHRKTWRNNNISIYWSGTAPEPEISSQFIYAQYCTVLLERSIKIVSQLPRTYTHVSCKKGHLQSGSIKVWCISFNLVFCQQNWSERYRCSVTQNKSSLILRSLGSSMRSNINTVESRYLKVDGTIFYKFKWLTSSIYCPFHPYHAPSFLPLAVSECDTKGSLLRRLRVCVFPTICLSVTVPSRLFYFAISLVLLTLLT